MSNTVEYIVGISDSHKLEAVRELRHAVLDPAKVEATELDVSQKDQDPINIVAVAFMGETAVSTARLDKIDEKTYLVRKMATADSARQQGIGGRVLELAEEEAVKRGAQTIELDSREGAISFYEGHGYVLTGEEVVHNDGIPNFSMIKRVTDG